MKKFAKPLILLAALLVVWQVVSLTTRRPDRPNPDLALSVKFDPAAVSRIEINRGAESVTLLNGEGGWKVKTAQAIKPADSAAVNGALSSLGTINTTDIVSHNPAKQADYSVQEGGGTRVRLYGRNDESLEDLIIGKLGGFESQQMAIQRGQINENQFFTYMRRGNGDRVYKVQGFFGGSLGTDAEQWRNHDLMKFNLDNCRQISLAYPGEKVVAERDTSGSWRLVEPRSDFPVDTVAIERIASTLSTLRAGGFIDSVVPAEKLGFDQPAVVAGVRLADNSEQQVSVGGKTDEGSLYYSLKQGDQQVYTLPEYRVTQIMKHSADLVKMPLPGTQK